MASQPSFRALTVDGSSSGEEKNVGGQYDGQNKGGAESAWDGTGDAQAMLVLLVRYMAG